MPKETWEFLIIDNASLIPLAANWDISWHPIARHVVEGELGLASARRRGIRESSTDLVVFVDDDNVLDPGYLLEAVRIKREWPVLGVWGSGCIDGEFELEPAEYLKQFLPSLALRQTTQARWANVPSGSDAMPWGAGLCVRKQVAARYCEFCEHSPIGITDRRGGILSSGGDKEISLVCCSNGLGMGVFPELRLTHLIPRERVSEDYLVRMAEGARVSDLLLEYKWNNTAPFDWRTSVALLASALRRRRVDRRMRFAAVRAGIKARRLIEAQRRRAERESAHA